MSKRELVIAAGLARASQSETSRRYGVSQGWVSRLMARYQAEDEAAFEPRSRRPLTSPTATPATSVEHECWQSDFTTTASPARRQTRHRRRDHHLARRPLPLRPARIRPPARHRPHRGRHLPRNHRLARATPHRHWPTTEWYIPLGSLATAADATSPKTSYSSAPSSRKTAHRTTLGPKIDAWYSGKAHELGGDIQALSAPNGLPLWISDVLAHPAPHHDQPSQTAPSSKPHSYSPISSTTISHKSR